MPTSTRRTDGTNRRALVALSAPLAVAAVASALTLAAPANAAGTSTPLPFPTSVCGTTTPAAVTPSASANRSASATASASASSTGSTKARIPQSQAASTPASAAPSASKSAAAGNGANVPTPSPSPSASGSSSGGFWGWLNGVWTWIWGSQQLPRVGAAPVQGAAFARSSVTVVHVAGKTTKKTGTIVRAGNPGAADPTPSPTQNCIPKSQIKKNTAGSGGNTAADVPWHLSAPSMTMYSLTYNGITSIQTSNGPEQVLDFTASKVTLVSMITYSHQGGGKIQYVNGGQGQTVTLNNVHLWTTSMTADVLGLIQQTFTPSSPGLLTALQGITIPLPVLFTHVEADNAFLNTQSIIIPGFDGHGN